MGWLGWVKRAVFASCVGGLAAYGWEVGVQRDRQAWAWLDRREHISVLERRIGEERSRLVDVTRDAARASGYGVDPERGATRCFETVVWPCLDEVIASPEDRPAIYVGVGHRNTVPSKVLLYGLLGSVVLVALASVYLEQERFATRRGVWERYARRAAKRSNAPSFPPEAVEAERRKFVGRRWKSAGWWGDCARLVACTAVQVSILAGVVCYAVPYVASVKNFYKPPFRDIQVEREGGGETREELAMTVAHEYAHFVQHVRGMDFCRTLWEGHANRVSLEAALRVYDRTKNGVFAQRLLEYDVDDLMDVYVTLCKRHGVSPSRDVLQTWDGEVTLSPYAVGSALFAVWEAKYGKQVYERVLRNDFGFLEEGEGLAREDEGEQDE